MDSVHFKSESDEWETPQDFFDKLNQIFNFKIDAAATLQNSKCQQRYEDGLKQLWEYSTFCNPPYSQLSQWVDHAIKSSLQTNEPIVMLIPARTDTKAFQKIAQYGSILFIKGRLKFRNPLKSTINPAPFPSALIFLNTDNYKNQIKTYLEPLGFLLSK